MHRASYAKNFSLNCDYLLSISLNMCFWCSKEPSHLDGSFEHPQHMLWMGNKKSHFQLRTLIWGPVNVGIERQKNDTQSI